MKRPVIARRDTCRFCGSRRMTRVFQLAPSPIGDAYVSADALNQRQEEYPIDLFLCGDCGLSQILDVIAPDVLYGDYIYVTASSLGLADHFSRYADDVCAALSLKDGALVVDIGSNDGTLLRCFRGHGMKVLGVDPAREIAERATADGIETLPEFFTPELANDVRRRHGVASVITANNVLANIDDLAPFMTGIRELLAPDGVFLFESFYLADLIRNMVFDFIYHEHLSAFTVMPVQSFMRRVGLELIDVKCVPTKGGSVRYAVQHAGGPRPVRSSVSDLIERERHAGLYRPDTFKAFAARVDVLSRQTHNLLSDLKSGGKKIAGFGASITATTLIYHFGIGKFIEYLVDENPAKQGRFSPGLHLPVFVPGALYDRKPDYAVVLAWRYADPIMRKHEAFRSQGGRFVIPVPEVRVV